MLTVLFSALIGGMALGQAAPNLKFFQAGRVSGARVFSVINRSAAGPGSSLGCCMHAECLFLHRAVSCWRH